MAIKPLDKLMPAAERNPLRMCPVFVRRGNVLFLLKTPADFLKRFHSGNIRPSDCLLVQNAVGSEWVQIASIRQFQCDGQVAVPTGADQGEKRLNRILRPGFNLKALAMGGWWFLFNDMPGLGLKWLGLSAAILLFALAAGFHYNLSTSASAALCVSAWIIPAIGCAVCADRARNRHCVIAGKQHDSNLRLRPLRIPPTDEKILN